MRELLFVNHSEDADQSYLMNTLRDNPQYNILPVQLDDQRKDTHRWVYELFVHDPDFDTLWDSVEEKYKDGILNGEGFLLFSHYYEGDTYSVFKRIYDVVENNKIPIDKCCFITGSLSIGRDLDEWQADHGLSMPMNYMQFTSQELPALSYDKFPELAEYQPSLQKDRSKKYINMNRLLRHHRVYMVSLLSHYGLLDDGYVSLFKDDVYGGNISDECFTDYIESPKFEGKVLDGYDKIKDQLPLCIDFEDGVHNPYFDIATEFHRDSYFSLISCTQYFAFERTSQFNEKIFKAIMHKQPFIIIGSPHFISDMKTYGFETFSPFIDESYDEIIDDEERMECIARETKRLSELSTEQWDEMIKEMEPILEKNFHRLANPIVPTFNGEHGLLNLLEYIS